MPASAQRDREPLVGLARARAGTGHANSSVQNGIGEHQHRRASGAAAGDRHRRRAEIDRRLENAGHDDRDPRLGQQRTPPPERARRTGPSVASHVRCTLKTTGSRATAARASCTTQLLPQISVSSASAAYAPRRDCTGRPSRHQREERLERARDRFRLVVMQHVPGVADRHQRAPGTCAMRRAISAVRIAATVREPSRDRTSRPPRPTARAPRSLRQIAKTSSSR